MLQGLLYMFVATLFMAYPQTADILNLSNVSFEEEDYRVCQCSMVGLLMIGVIFINFGLSDSINTHIRPRLLGRSNVEMADSSIFFNMITTWDRIIVFPFILMVVLLTYGSGDVMIQTMGGFFLVIDPLLGLITLILLKKYGNEDVMIKNKNA